MLMQILTNELLWIVLLALYSFTVVMLTKKIYDYYIEKRVKKNVIIYYNRKLIHIFAGGVVVLVVPFVFSSPWYPLMSGLLLTVVTLIAHKTGNIFYWFQTDEDLNDVSFCFMWAVAIFILWIVFDNPWIAVIPPAFIAFGDGITGIVRNVAFKERRKHPIGNIYMGGVCIIIGYTFAKLSNIEGLVLWGIIAAIVVSIVERYEYKSIDDNVLITVTSTAILYAGSLIGPIV